MHEHSFPTRRSSDLIPFILLGTGSNVLFSEKGFKGLIIKNCWSEMKKTDGNKIFASSGVEMALLVDYFRKNGMGSIEWAGGLPGTLGGAVRGNAGAFLGEIKDSVCEVESFCYSGTGRGIINRKNSQCRFRYRDSIFKHNNEIILGVLLKYRKADKSIIGKKIRECKKYRETHQPLDHPSAGSFFKNIPVGSVSSGVRKIFRGVIKNDPFPLIPAAAVTDLLGLKGRQIGGARISEMHPNFIINTKKASFSDVITLKRLIERMAFKKFGIKMVTEVQIVG
jgi:UDP-N-acetylmuramate dehydrogenase